MFNSSIGMKVSDSAFLCKWFPEGYALDDAHWCSTTVTSPFKLAAPPSSTSALIQESSKDSFFFNAIRATAKLQLHFKKQRILAEDLKSHWSGSTEPCL